MMIFQIAFDDYELKKSPMDFICSFISNVINHPS